MKPASLANFTYLAYLSKPSEERVLYRAFRSGTIRSVVEMGLGSCLRTRRLLAVARRFAADEPLKYTGIDLFEGRCDGRVGVTLKQAHQMLSATGVKTQLFPGDPFSALARAANRLTRTDLLLIAGDQDPEALERAWFYIPRMLHEDSLVFLQAPTAPGDPPAAWQQLSVAEIQARGKRPARAA